MARAAVLGGGEGSSAAGHLHSAHLLDVRIVAAARRGARAVALGAVAGVVLTGWRRRRGTTGRTPAREDAAQAGEGWSSGGRRPQPGAPPAGQQAEAAAEDVPDDVLVARVRAQAAVPAGVEVVVTEGAIVLFGRVPRFELQPLLRRVAQVAGVTVVEDRLTGVDLPPA